ncbi:Hydroxymethylpyrimidine/phosphomethylpyrimidine kinase, partial [Haemophilus influenzae]
MAVGQAFRRILK